MATMNERKLESIRKEIEKLNKSLDRQTGILAKKTAKCVKLGCDWTEEEWRERRDSGTMTGKQDEAWFDRYCTESEVEDLNRRIANATKRFERMAGVVEQDTAKAAEVSKVQAIDEAWIQAQEAKAEKLYKAWKKMVERYFKENGIEPEEITGTYISGKTASGKGFQIYINNGFTGRSNHCYTLSVDGYTVFTSGTLATCFAYIR